MGFQELYIYIYNIKKLSILYCKCYTFDNDIHFLTIQLQKKNQQES